MLVLSQFSGWSDTEHFTPVTYNQLLMRNEFYLFWRDLDAFVDVHGRVRPAAGAAVVKRTSKPDTLSSGATADSSNLNINGVRIPLINLNTRIKIKM